MRCAVFGCNNSNQGKNKTNISMYHFPKNLKTQKKWLLLMCRKDKINTINARVCAEHFTADDYQRDKLMASLNLGEVVLNKLKVDAVPSRNMPGNKKETAVGLVRRSRALKTNVKASSTCFLNEHVETTFCQNITTNRVEPNLMGLIVESQNIEQTTARDPLELDAPTAEYFNCDRCGAEIAHTCGAEPYQKLQQKLRYTGNCTCSYICYKIFIFLHKVTLRYKLHC